MPKPQPIVITLRPARNGASTKGHLPILFHIEGMPAEVAGVCKSGTGWCAFGARIAPKGMSLVDFAQWEADKEALAAFRDQAESLKSRSK